jgi:hypothetical protein
MQFPADIFADNFRQTAFVGGMDIFIIGENLELEGSGRVDRRENSTKTAKSIMIVIPCPTHTLIHTQATCTHQKTHLPSLPFPLYLSQTPLNLLLLPLVQYPCFEQGFGEGNGAFDVGCVHAFIIFERLVEFVHSEE